MRVGVLYLKRGDYLVKARDLRETVPAIAAQTRIGVHRTVWFCGPRYGAKRSDDPTMTVLS